MATYNIVELKKMADVLHDVAKGMNGRPVGDVLQCAAEKYGTTPSQMKYALTFANVRNWIKIDYDSGTVSASNLEYEVELDD